VESVKQKKKKFVKWLNISSMNELKKKNHTFYSRYQHEKNNNFKPYKPCALSTK